MERNRGSMGQNGHGRKEQKEQNSPAPPFHAHLQKKGLIRQYPNENNKEMKGKEGNIFYMHYREQ